MSNKITISFSFLVVAFNTIFSQSLDLTKQEKEALNNALQNDTNLTEIFSWYGVPEKVYEQYKYNKYKADSIWSYEQQSLNRINELGTIRKVEIIPIIDWFTESDSLRVESGVSYLIRTDSLTLLFDLGLNKNQEHPSPLLHNMDQLEINTNEIDCIFISHDHGDHVGGHKWWQSKSFSLTNNQINLDGIQVFTPIKLTYPGIHPQITNKPAVISCGIATTGAISNPIMFMDIAEQALVLNVKDKGLIIILGCGHQGVEKLLQRCRLLFSQPIYAILGGFHYPLNEERNIDWTYKYFVTEKLPWELLSTEDVKRNINLLKSAGVKYVGVSGHDSCDKALDLFKQEFGENYFTIKVGQKITY